MKFILGKKNSMTQIWKDDLVIACTPVQVGPCFITQIKDEKSDSYKAVQISYGQRKAKNISKSVKGHLKKSLGREDIRHLKEFRIKENNSNLELGKMIDASTFSVGDIVDVVSTSKGKGFQGVVKRHGFSGTKKTHGNKDQLRASGSIGAKGPAHVFKGKRMPGRMGGDRVTIKNLEIVDIDLENNILYVKGAIPGAINALVMIKGEGDLVVKDFSQEKQDKKEEVVKPSFASSSTEATEDKKATEDEEENKEIESKNTDKE